MPFALRALCHLAKAYGLKIEQLNLSDHCELTPYIIMPLVLSVSD